MDSPQPLRITSRQRVLLIFGIAVGILGLGYAKAQMHDSWVAEKAAKQAYVAEMPAGD